MEKAEREEHDQKKMDAVELQWPSHEKHDNTQSMLES